MLSRRGKMREVFFNMLELFYDSGEILRIGDKVRLLPPLVEREILGFVKTFIFPWEERRIHLDFKNPGILFADSIGHVRVPLELIPVPEKNERWFTSTDFSEEFRRTWSCVHFVGRGKPCYYTGEPVKIGDIVAVECGFDTSWGDDRIEIGRVGRIVFPFETHLMQTPLNWRGSGLMDLGVLIVDPCNPLNIRWVEQIVDEKIGCYTDEWQHIRFIRRGRLVPPKRPTNVAAGEIWDRLFEMQK